LVRLIKNGVSLFHCVASLRHSNVSLEALESGGPVPGASLSNTSGGKMRNHAAATALNYFAYNFIKIHRTLRTSPAMAAGVTNRLWGVEDLVALWEAYEQRRAERQIA
jgi:hypothetical protein